MAHMDHQMYYLKPDQRGAQRYAMGLLPEDVAHRAKNPSITGRRELVLLTESSTMRGIVRPGGASLRSAVEHHLVHQRRLFAVEHHLAHHKLNT